jgi:hypothetical protein
VVEDLDTGLTALRLDSALSRRAGRSISRDSDGVPDCGRRNDAALSLGGFLHFLGSQTGLTRSRPEFEG